MATTRLIEIDTPKEFRSNSDFNSAARIGDHHHGDQAMASGAAVTPADSSDASRHASP
jgi:hypothetical protein